jgi:hypothetical protein
MAGKAQQKKRSPPDDGRSYWHDRLDLDPGRWHIDVDKTKGALSGTRGVVVTVTCYKTTRSRKLCGTSSTKKGLDDEAFRLIKQAVKELS